MSAHDLSTDWTVDRALAIPDDGNRYEVLDGELSVTPAPSWDHQGLVEALFPPLDSYVRANALGWTKLSPADIVFSPRRLVQPDLFVVPRREHGRPRSWREVDTLLLAVEVLSPSTADTDRHHKRLIYQTQRVPEYWIVNADARAVERWHPDDAAPEMIRGTLHWRPREDLVPLRIDLPELFARVLDSD
ncbi:MAG TPA: Uma2 family endonuclease [Gemmatimonadaceae bacterium]|nr:Uma2 family endonuclease [Gemmatimonadaceae bacterium]